MNPTMTYLNIVLHQVSINPAKAMGAPPQPSPAISIVVGTLTTASSREVQRKRETGPNLEKTCRSYGLLRILEKTTWGRGGPGMRTTRGVHWPAGDSVCA